MSLPPIKCRFLVTTLDTEYTSVGSQNGSVTQVSAVGNLTKSSNPSTLGSWIPRS